jgi:cysteine-rich repeat protein
MNRFTSILVMSARQAIGRGPGWQVGSWLLVLALAGCQEQPYRVCDTGLVCQLGYECSPGGDFCVLPNGCGNGRIDFGEVCDDGNLASGDGCSQGCTSDERCGNGVRDRWESCDDGNTEDGDGCSRICRLQLCGSGTRDQGEPCDEAPAAVAEPEDTAAAEAAMWSYYRLWSAIARSAISDRRLLRKLGFLRSQRAGNDGEDAGQDDLARPRPAPQTAAT